MKPPRIRFAALLLSLLLCLPASLASCGLFRDPNEGKVESAAILTQWTEANNALVITLSESESFVFPYASRIGEHACLGEWHRGGDVYPAVLHRDSERMNCGISFEKAPAAWSYGYALYKVTDLPSFLAGARGYSSDFAYMENTEFLATLDYNVGANRYVDGTAEKTVTVTVEPRKLHPETLGFVDPLWRDFTVDAERARFVSENGDFSVSGADGHGTWTVGDTVRKIRVEFVPETPAFLVYDVTGDAPRQILFAVGRMEDGATFVADRYAGTMFYEGAVTGLMLVRERVSGER